jgi:hypothetical protein
MAGRVTITLIILSFILSACNLPIKTTVTPDLIASQVAILLTSNPNETPDIQQTNNAQATEIISPTDTVTDKPNPTVTLTTTETPTPTLANVPTGSPSWFESFETGSSFGITGGGYDDGNTRIYIDSGSMVLTSLNRNGWRGWRLTSQKPENYYIKAVFQTSECSGSDQYGLVLQSPDFDSGFGYYFGLTCDGRYSIQMWDDSGLSNLDGWSPSTSIQSGANKKNNIAVLKSGSQFKYFVNDVVLSQVENEGFSSPGVFGPFIAGLETSNFMIRLDEISYWKLP